MRTAWKGTLTFGLLAIPLRLGVAADKDKSLFHQMHDAGCGGRIRQKRICDAGCPGEVAWEHVASGVEVGGAMVAVTDAEIEALRAWEPKTIRLLHFCQASEISARMLDASYYVEPVDGGGPAHQLLLAAMTQTPGLVAVCEMAYPQRVALAMLQPAAGGMFEVITLRWPEQVRPADVKIPNVAAPRPQEVKMATALVKTMTRPFVPAEHADTYRQQLADLVAAKAAGAPVPAAQVRDPAAAYADMMDLLQASIAEQKKTATKPRARRSPAAKAS